jgi:hypothetical protein
MLMLTCIDLLLHLRLTGGEQEARVTVWDVSVKLRTCDTGAIARTAGNRHDDVEGV